MWKFLEALLSGSVDDPLLIAVGAAGAFILWLTFGALTGFAVGAVLRGRSFPGLARLLGSPWTPGLAAAAGMVLVGLQLSPAALASLSTWVTSAGGGSGAGL